jgi:hypothetical protein
MVLLTNPYFSGKKIKSTFKKKNKRTSNAIDHMTGQEIETSTEC